MKQFFCFLLIGLLSFAKTSFADEVETPVQCKTTIVGAGLAGAIESYYAFKDAQKNGKKICITVYEKCAGFSAKKWPSLPYDLLQHRSKSYHRRDHLRGATRI